MSATLLEKSAFCLMTKLARVRTTKKIFQLIPDYYNLLYILSQKGTQQQQLQDRFMGILAA